MRKGVVQLYIKNNEVIFSLARNIFSDNFEVLVLKYLEIKDVVFLSQKVDGNMIFTNYWKVLVLTFLEIGNTVFSWAKKLTEIWYLLVTGKFLFWNFWWWDIRSFFWAKTLMERWYLLATEKFLIWTFRWWEIRSFLQPKSWWKDDIYVAFLCFLWYFRTWEIRLFAQCILYLRWSHWCHIHMIFSSRFY